MFVPITLDEIKSQRFQRRWESFILRTDTCWLWRGKLSEKGYGHIKLRTAGFRNVPAHRVAWTLANGEIPNGILVLHHCDVRHCVNPLHLFTGTNNDNMADMKAKGRGRSQRGEAQHAHRLTESQVNEIRQRYIRGVPSKLSAVSQHGLARQYSVSAHTIHSIITGQSWKHLLQEGEV